jgi:hypothetical protein
MTANRIIDHIFQQPDLPQVDQAALAKLVKEYPYFTAGRLLLAQKDYYIHNNLDSPAIKKAMLYSNNPHYVYQFITGELEKAEESNDTQLSQPTAEIPPVETVVEIPPPVEVMEEEEPVVVTATGIQEEVVLLVAEAAVPVVEIEEEEVLQVQEEVIALPEIPEMVNVQEVPEPKAEEEEVAAPSVIAVATPAAAINHEEHYHPVYPADTPDQDDPIKIFPLDIPAEETTLTFQPLYTDDYFAYKRLKEPARADDLNDKGMAEMKSFTEWLRQMKDSFAGKAQKDWYHQHLHHIYEDEEPGVSEAVEQMAMNSITLNDDIVSETLAEIWARQHQYPAAIHIYQKLSLLNPDKSAYFAQKIQELQLQKDKINSNKH